MKSDRRRFVRLAAAMTLVVPLFGTVLSGVANAEVSNGESTILRYRGGECHMKSDNPHYSFKGLSVIFKTRVECIGTEAPVVRVSGAMNYVLGGLPGLPSGDPMTQVAPSLEEQLVPIGKTVTFYTPMKDKEKLIAPGTYQGVATGETVAPVHSNLNSYETARTYVLPPLP